MSKYDDLAVQFVQTVRENEREYDETYQPNTVRRSVVHSREDISLIAFHTAHINNHLATIRRLAWVTVFLLGVLVIQMGELIS